MFGLSSQDQRAVAGGIATVVGINVVVVSFIVYAFKEQPEDRKSLKKD